MSIYTKEQLKNMLEDVINELDLNESAINSHGELGTSPSVLVRMVLDQKDAEISRLKNGLIPIN